MKQIYACLFYLCGVGVVSLVGVASAETLSVGIGVSERHGVHQDWFERNRFLYNVVENSMPDNSYGGRRDPKTPYQRRQAQPFGNDGNEDINLPDNGGNRTMNPSADVPDSVHGSGDLKTWPGARPGPEGDPSVRDLSGSGLSEPGGAPGALGR
jgi:hypothetical protein